MFPLFIRLGPKAPQLRCDLDSSLIIRPKPPKKFLIFFWLNFRNNAARAGFEPSTFRLGGLIPSL